MIMKKFALGMLGANCYMLIDEETRQALVIDPGGEAQKVLNQVRMEKVKLVGILLTHGHYDHIGAADEIRKQTGADILIHKKDAEMLKDPALNLSIKFGPDGVSFEADRLLKHEDTITFGKTTGKILHTPGHTQGGVCLLVDNQLYAGDTLFLRSVGRTDLPGGNGPQLERSIKERLYSLSRDVVVYPGHGPETTIGFEMEKNFVVRA